MNRLTSMSLILVAIFASCCSPQTPEPSRLIALKEIFTDLPILWNQDEPLAKIGNWLKALRVDWNLSDKGLQLNAPNKVTCFWAKGMKQVNVRGQTIEVSPLLCQGGSVWIPLVSLARLLGLKAIVNAEKRTVKLTSPLQKIEVSQNEIGWLATLTFGYPLSDLPKLGTLRYPERAYADFLGASLDQTDLPEVKDLNPLTGLRLGQFSDEPPIVRFVADALEPVTIRTVGREISEDGFEKWHLLIQPASKPNRWLGQIFIKENEPKRAVVLILGWLEGGINLKQSAKTVTVSLPEKPILSSDLSLPNDGILESVALETEVSGTKLTISLREPANVHWQFESNIGVAVVIESLSNRARQVRLIVVDAGHGGKDPGAISPFRSGKLQLIEKHLTLDIAFRLKSLLEKIGYKVVMTRTDDTYIPLPERVAIANSIQADAFVSIHLNAFPQPGGQWGTEVYFWTPQSYPLAECVYRNLLSLLGRKGNGIRQRQLYVVRHTIMPSVLVEPCYLNHPEEEELLRSEEFRERIALAIFRGLVEFFGDLAELKRRGE
ncbi:MAG: N-acetylmuramoyl-L-alanine amidase [Armatimonadetes bacterium]|nr:N-acetylmuramoyl-L-alanine amidase [Armatimonadota bacterium]MDW8029154.1 N-acetylmuramoyl-L-alanine amidase [Armatimonadota bacterium]